MTDIQIQFNTTTKQQQQHCLTPVLTTSHYVSKNASFLFF